CTDLLPLTMAWAGEAASSDSKISGAIRRGMIRPAEELSGAVGCKQRKIRCHHAERARLWRAGHTPSGESNQPAEGGRLSCPAIFSGVAERPPPLRWRACLFSRTCIR